MGEPSRVTAATVLRRPAFRRLWAARTVSQWGDVVGFVGLAIVVYRLTGSGVGVAGVVVAEVLPVLLLAPLAGVVVDRLPRVRVMVAADLFRAVLAAVLAVAHDDVRVVYAVAVGLSAGAVFFSPAAGSLLPSLVPDRELVAANSATWTAAVLSQVVLAPLGGGLVALTGVGAVFALNAASFAGSALLLRGVSPGEPPRPVAARRWRVEAREGLAVVGRDRLLRALAVGQLLAALSAGGTSALLVVLAAQSLRVRPDAYGLLVGAIGVGAVLGPTVLLRLVPDPRRAPYVFGPFALRGLVDLVLAATRSLPVATGALVLYGVGTSTGAVTFASLLQSRVTPQARGRVFALMDLLWQSGRLVSLGVGGVLADAVGVQAVYYLGGGLLLLAAAGGLRAARAAPVSPG